MLTASAVGFYGDRGEKVLNEDSPAGTGFLAGVCQEWETAAEPAEKAGIRVVKLRFGTVLSSQGGALAAMLPAFKMGLGGKFGRGDQYLSWIGIEDTLQAILHCMLEKGPAGPVNLVAPQAVRNLEFTRTLARVLGRPAFFHLPSFLLKAVLGRAAEELLLSSIRGEPARLLENGFTFRHPELEKALLHLLIGKQR